MKFEVFKRIISEPRINRYLNSVGNDSRKAMTLYRKNLRLSQEIFTIISCFEVALRNAIDMHYTQLYGPEWLKDFVIKGGRFDVNNCQKTRLIILAKLNPKHTHSKLVSELDFGLWRYLFAQPQFRAGGQTLLHVFPSKPRSTPTIQYNQTFVFNELAKINELRNRIAHHEPICFSYSNAIINTTYIRQNYNLILQLFQWMNINESELLYGLDHVVTMCDEIDALA